jgi:hypothetical protein
MRTDYIDGDGHANPMANINNEEANKGYIHPLKKYEHLCASSLNSINQLDQHLFLGKAFSSSDFSFSPYDLLNQIRART